ncbi:MAG: hypothetical protein WDN04_03865 [Rhodospirillales bacterium]
MLEIAQVFPALVELQARRWHRLIVKRRPGFGRELVLDKTVPVQRQHQWRVGARDGRQRNAGERQAVADHLGLDGIEKIHPWLPPQKETLTYEPAARAAPPRTTPLTHSAQRACC